jgi:PAS domain S-box-containing protein
MGQRRDDSAGADARAQPERLARTLVESSPGLLVWSCDAEGRFVFLNKAWEAALGYPIDELLGRTFASVQPHLPPRSFGALAEELAAASVAGYELTLVRKEGRDAHLLVHAVATRDAEGRILDLEGTAVDITARKVREGYREEARHILEVLNEPATLRQSIQRVLTALKSRTGVDAVGIRLQEGEDYPYFVEEGFSDSFLKTENTLLKRDAKRALCRAEDGTARLECTCGLVIAGKPNRYLTPGGTFWTNDSYPLLDLPRAEDPRDNARNQCIHHGFASVALVPIRVDAKVVGLIQLNARRHGAFTPEGIEVLEGIASQLGQALLRRRAEEALKQSLALYHDLVETSQDLIWRCDAEGRYTYLNPAWEQALGYPIRAMLGRTFTEFLPPEDATRGQAALAQILKEGSAKDLEAVLVGKQGNLVHLVFNAKRLLDASGAPCGLRGAAFDLTQQKAAEDELRRLAAELAETARLKDIFTDILRHDILNPVGAIKMAADVLLETETDPTKARLLQTVRRSTANLAEMTVNAAKLASLSAPQASDFREADPVQVLHTVLPDFDHALREKDLTLAERVAGEGFRARFNPLVKEVFANLLSNAIKYSPNGARIELTVEDREDSWLFSVRDDGSGVPDAHKQSIFNRFERIEKQGVKGTGLGLTITREIVRLHHGDVWVEDGPERGSVFVVRLPKDPSATSRT